MYQLKLWRNELLKEMTNHFERNVGIKWRLRQRKERRTTYFARSTDGAPRRWTVSIGGTPGGVACAAGGTGATTSDASPTTTWGVSGCKAKTQFFFRLTSSNFILNYISFLIHIWLKWKSVTSNANAIRSLASQAVTKSRIMFEWGWKVKSTAPKIWCKWMEIFNSSSWIDTRPRFKNCSAFFPLIILDYYQS